MNKRLPSTRLVAFRTARAAPRGVSSSVRKQPDQARTFPFRRDGERNDHHIGVEGPYRLYPSSSNLMAPWTAFVRAITQAWAAQRNSPAWDVRPSASAV